MTTRDCPTCGTPCEIDGGGYLRPTDPGHIGSTPAYPFRGIVGSVLRWLRDSGRRT